MRFRTLVIGRQESIAIAKVIEYAQAHEYSINDLFNLMAHPERAPGNNPQHVCVLPKGYRCTFTFEHQPIGFCHHLSISVLPLESTGIPSLPAQTPAKMIALAFGLSNPFKSWHENILLENGRTFQAFNLIQKE